MHSCSLRKVKAAGATRLPFACLPSWLGPGLHGRARRDRELVQRGVDVVRRHAEARVGALVHADLAWAGGCAIARGQARRVPVPLQSRSERQEEATEKMIGRTKFEISGVSYAGIRIPCGLGIVLLDHAVDGTRTRSAS